MGGKSYNDEMHDLKESFKNSNEVSSDEDDDRLLQPKLKTAEDKSKEDGDYKKWLAGQKNNIQDTKIKKELSGLHDFWSKKDLESDEKFLRDYILNKKYLGTNDEGDEDNETGIDDI